MYSGMWHCSVCGTNCACLVDTMCGTNCACSVTPCVEHAKSLPRFLLSSPFPFSVSWDISPETAVCSDTTSNLHAAFQISSQLFVCNWTVSAMATRSMLRTAWHTSVKSVCILRACVFCYLLYHAGKLFLCFVGVLFYSYYLNSQITGYILIVSAMCLLSFINQLLHSLWCMGYYQTLHMFALCLCMYIFLLPTHFHAFCYLGPTELRSTDTGPIAK
jgi:hypothetical protein